MDDNEKLGKVAAGTRLSADTLRTIIQMLLALCCSSSSRRTTPGRLVGVRQTFFLLDFRQSPVIIHLFESDSPGGCAADLHRRVAKWRRRRRRWCGVGSGSGGWLTGWQDLTEGFCAGFDIQTLLFTACWSNKVVFPLHFLSFLSFFGSSEAISQLAVF